MRKIIDIPNEIVEPLQIMAIKAKKDLKNFIQDELKKLVQNSHSKPSLLAYILYRIYMYS